jgi:lipid-A-disaccharide synthase
MHIFFSVGEPSGDQHAAELIDELRRRRGDLRITGFGGPLMERAGCERLYPLTDIAVMGFFRVLPLLWTFYKLVRQADEYLARERPDAVILIDVPGFNWWIARKAKKHGIPVFYFLPPQLWAWAPWRVHKVRRLVDHILSGLSFEVEWYRRRGIDCEFVGHPFFDEVARHRLDETFLERVRDESSPIVGLLPGSRAQEVRGNFPIMLEVIRQLRRSHPQARFLVACYKEVQREMCRQMLTEAVRRDPSLGEVPIELEVGRTPEIIEAADCCLIVSGSVSLELLARRTPTVVVYHGTWWLMVLRWIFVTCRYVTLPNLMAGREIMPEFVFSGRYDGPVAQMTGILDRWLADEPERAAAVAELDGLAAAVAQTGGTARAAEYVLDRIAPAVRQNAA